MLFPKFLIFFYLKDRDFSSAGLFLKYLQESGLGQADVTSWEFSVSPMWGTTKDPAAWTIACTLARSWAWQWSQASDVPSGIFFYFNKNFFFNCKVRFLQKG